MPYPTPEYHDLARTGRGAQAQGPLGADGKTTSTTTATSPILTGETGRDKG